MFPAMKGFLLAALVLVGCRPADGGSQNTPSVRRETMTVIPPDSARIDSLLQRADAGRIQGSPGAQVWIVEVSDFQCPFCKRWHDEVYPALKREFITPGIVRMAYLNLPLGQHRHALAAAEAAMCTALQDKFWTMHDKLFETQTRWTDMQPAAVATLFDSLAVASGVNADDWRACVRSQLMRRIVNGDRTRAASSGVRSTPTFFVGDQPIEGAAPLSEFRSAIERARAKAGGRPPR
jgi:protein-disulfide isomerase